MARPFPFPGREEQGFATTCWSSLVLWSSARNWPLQRNCHSWGCLLSLSTLARKAWREKEEVYNFASKVVLSLLADIVLDTTDTAKINVSSCFPNQSICLGWECQLAENWKTVSSPWLSTVVLGVLLLSPIKYENLWMWHYLSDLHILVTFPTAFFITVSLI